MTDSPLNFFEFQSIDALQTYCSRRGESWMLSVIQDPAFGSGLFIAPNAATGEYELNFSPDVKGWAVSLPSFLVVENAIRNNVNVFAFAKSCHFCRLGDGDCSHIRRYFKSLRDLETETPSILSYEARYHVSHALMDTVCLMLYNGVARNLPRPADVVFRFMKLVYGNCEKERKMDFYASDFQLSTKYLSTVISNETGRSVSKWIELFAISAAKQHLRNSSLSINQVSTMMNFRSTSDFSKYFRNATGMSPNEYRRTLPA